MPELGILDLLGLAGFSRSSRAKLVRHQDARYDAQELFRRGWLETYQSFQAKPVFNNTDFVVSFLGMGGTRARFLGIYRVLGHRASALAPLPPGCPYSEWQDAGHFYDLARESGYEHLEGRVVIDWGKGTLAWHQRLTNKPVLEVLPAGYLLEPFNDYLGFTIAHSELRHLVAHQEANAGWRARLSAVAGVYLILATTSGAQYVGSAYGSGGIWARWSNYARDGHGGNALLSSLVASDPAYPAAFSYSVLQIFPTSFARAVVLDQERRFKEKLGSRATGLNAN